MSRKMGIVCRGGMKHRGVFQQILQEKRREENNIKLMPEHTNSIGTHAGRESSVLP
jgi:hypothetical protein